MSLPLLTRNELKLFSNEFKLTYLERHGSLLYFKINNDKITTAIYEIEEFRTQVLKSWPDNLLEDIILISEDDSVNRCLCLVFQN
jgi:hypothetical protein